MNLKASRVRSEMASELMDYHDPEPAHLPSAEVGRRIRSEALQSRRMDQDPVKSLQILKYSTNPIYMYCIREIGLDPFSVHICTPDQIKLYSRYCSTTYSRMIIDATGRLVQRLQNPGNNTSGHIFLYLGVIRMAGSGESIIPVTQMLSERHNANAIQYWLAEWVRGGAPIPKEIVIDDSAALISAICKVFGGESSTAAYLEKAFQFMNRDEAAKPNCLIRIDVAHLTNLICKWPQIKEMKKRSKEFFIRVIILIAKSQTIQEAKELIIRAFIVALSETEGTSETTGEPTPCEVNKKILLSKISGISVAENIDKSTPISNDGYLNTDSPSTVEEENERCNIIKCWVECMETQAKEESSLDDGDRDNVMYQPSIVSKMKKLLYILPLWCSAFPIKMDSPYIRSIGAYVETEIGHLKNNLLQKSVRIDDFVKDYLKVCDGAVKLASSHQASPNPQTNEDEQCNVSRTEDERGVSHLGKSQQKKSPVDKSPKVVQSHESCPACANGDLPGGAHRCLCCKTAVHALEECSVIIGEEEEGYGQNRLCLKCYAKQPEQSNIEPGEKGQINSKEIVSHPVNSIKGSKRKQNQCRSDITQPKKKKNKQILIRQTSIVERTDLSTVEEKDNKTAEATSVEGWKGLALPSKTRPSGYYWRANPDFPLLLTSSKSTKLGVLKNGMDPTLKIINIGKSQIALSNTCSFDAPCQVFASAYCDSEMYREAVNGINITNSMLDVAKYIAIKGVKPMAYKKRATILASSRAQKTPLKGGIIRVDCAMDSSALLRDIGLPPTLTENYTCSSPCCPSPAIVRKISVIPVIINTKSENDLGQLEYYLSVNAAEETSGCFQPIADVSALSPDTYIIDPELSVKGPVCAGLKKQNSEEAGPHLIIEVIGAEERRHTEQSHLGVREFVNCALGTIPRTVSFKNKTFFLRGAVGFMPPFRDSDIGHYRAYCVRTDLVWEIYDDLREKPILVDSSVEINIHVILYTL